MTDSPSTSGTPVVFIHGLWLHATSWQPWMDLFTAQGYQPLAPGWPGEPATLEEARANPAAVAGLGIDAVTDHFATVISSLDISPILIGHSFGGLIAQKLLGRGIGVAAVAIDPAQIRGVLTLPLSHLKSVFPVLRNPLNARRAISLTEEQFRYGFANAVSEQECAELYATWTIPSPAKPLFEASIANFNPWTPAKVDTGNSSRGPLLLVSGLADNTVPDATTRATYKLYRKSTAVTDLKQFDGRGHSLVVDSGWQEIAEAALAWLKTHDL